MGIDAEVKIFTKNKLTPDEIREKSFRLGAVLGAENFFSHSNSFFITQEKDNLYNIVVSTRYYGPDYERGNWIFLRTLFEFLPRLFPGCTILYGGDHEDALEKVDQNFIREMDNHFFRVGHEPYRAYGKPNKVICPLCKHPANEFGWAGMTSTISRCSGCGTMFHETQGKVWKLSYVEQRTKFEIPNRPYDFTLEPSP